MVWWSARSSIPRAGGCLVRYTLEVPGVRGWLVLLGPKGAQFGRGHVLRGCGAAVAVAAARS
eukprot:10296369-Lingulodinium_polyedra.AAC.1